MSIAIIAVCALFPALILILKERIRFFAKWSPLITCYAVGLILGNIGILPEGSTALLDMISTVAVAIAIPLLLFSVDIRKWRELTEKAGLAFALACVAVILISILAHLVFRSRIPDSAQVAGMLVGVYTGGTPNLAAIKTALNVNMNTYLAVHSSDIILSAVYYLFVITAAKRVFGKFLPPYRSRGIGVPAGGSLPSDSGEESFQSAVSLNDAGEVHLFSDLFKRGMRLPLLKALLIDIVIVGIGLGISLMVPQTFQTMTAILVFTTLAILASLLPGVRSIRGTFAAGEYVLYVFCFAVGAMGNFRVFIGTAPIYFLYVMMVLFGSFIIHAILCAIFRVDVETMLVVSTSAINSPPFVGPVCVALNNRELLVPGITTGIIGYAVGNYLGIALAGLLGG